MENIYFNIIRKNDNKYPFGFSIETELLNGDIQIGNETIRLKNFQIVFAGIPQSQAGNIFIKLLGLFVMFNKGIGEQPIGIGLGAGNCMFRVIDIDGYYRIIVCDDNGNTSMSMAYPYVLQYSSSTIYPFSMN